MNSQKPTLPVNRRVVVMLLQDDAILAAVETLSASLKGIHKQDELLRRLLDHVFECIPAKRGAVLLAGPKVGDLQPAAFHGGEFSVDTTIPAQALRERAGVLSNTLCAPIGDHGVIYLQSSRRRAFTMPHLELLIALADEATYPVAYTAQIERVERENEDFRKHNYVDRGIVGESRQIRDAHTFIKKVAPLDTRLLILGESGTGKDLLSRAIHDNSPRKEAGGSFVTVNCAAVPDDLVESELFGHEKGAFTGATEMQKGAVEAAMGGTLFLDEVGELSMRAQAKLLRCIETGEFKRVGSPIIRHSDARIISATNRDLPDMVRKGKFREDLFFRLRIVEFRMPALRERPDDVILIAKHFLAKFRRSPSKAKRFSAEALDALRRYDWPGNVRQLHSVVEQAVIFCDSELLELRHLHPDVTAAKLIKAGSLGFKALVKAYEAELLRTTLNATGHNRAKTARILDLSERHLRRLLDEFDVKAT